MIQQSNIIKIAALSLIWLASVHRSSAQAYAFDFGAYQWTTPIPVTGGYTDAANGNLHIEIPIVSIPERGHVPFVATLVYDSHIWQIGRVSGSQAWQPTNVPNSWGGWRLISSAGTGGNVTYTVTSGTCTIIEGKQEAHPPYTQYTNFTWTAPDGRKIPFGGLTYYDNNDGCGPEVTSTNSIATDASGYHIYITNYTSAVVYAPDGTQIYPNVEDTNGNYYSGPNSSGDVTDTLGNKPITTTVSGSTITYSVMNSQGTTSPYTVTTESAPTNTSFGQSGITEFNQSVTVIEKIQLPDSSTYQFQYDPDYGTLTQMTLPTGGVVTFGYENFKEAYGNQTYWLTSYAFNGGTWDFTPSVTSNCTSSCTTNCPTCTQQVVATGPAGETATYGFTLNTGAWNTSVSAGDESTSTTYNFSNLPYVVPATTLIKHSTPSPYGVTKQISYAYDSSNLGNITQVTESSFETGSPYTAYRTTTYTYLSNSDNNMVNKKQTIAVCAGAGPCSSSNYVSMTQINYDTATTTSITGVIDHDDTNFGTSYNARGNPTQILRMYPGGSTSTQITYDMTGQVLTSTDNDNNVTSFSYADEFDNDSSSGPNPVPPAGKTNAYVTTITLPSPFHWSITSRYYLYTGQKSTSVDPNGLKTISDFVDPFNRLTESYAPTGYNSQDSWREIVYSASETQVDSYVGIQSASPTTNCTGSNGYCRHDELSLDSFGRPTQQSMITDPDEESTVSTTYSTDAKVSKITNPQRTTSSPTDGNASYTYDSLGRITNIAHSDGTASSVYFGASVTSGGAGGIAAMLCTGEGLGYPILSVDESGKKRQSWSDSLGRTIELDETDNSGNLTINTCYSYDVLGDLIGVTQGTQTRSYSYDALARLTSSTTPESGTVYYNYLNTSSQPCSGNPNLPCTKGDARHYPVTYTYDQLNRLTGISYSDGKTHSITYTYDGTNELGYRTGMSDASGSSTWTYYLNGWVKSELRTIAGQAHTLSYTYNGDGTVASVTYPSGNVISYNVGGAERPISAMDTANNLNYVGGASYAPPGELNGMIYGKATGFNGITGSATYNSRLELTGASASTSSATAQSLSFNYNNNGTVSTIQNSITPTLGLSFTYDSLDRILSGATTATSGSGCWAESYGPSGAPPPGPPDDRWGNLTQMNSNQSNCPADNLAISANSSTNQLTGTGLAYDAVGNMTGDGSGYSYTFDSENHLSQVSGTPTGTWTYTYDGNGVRVEKTNGSTGTLYWRDLAGNTIAETDLTGSTTDSSYREYIFFAGQRVAQRDSSTPTPNVYFYYTDQVGSITSISTAAGASCYQATFTPYGKEMATQSNCSSNYKFTGYERDAETGLDYAFARYYNWRIGRFMSADPLGGSNADPQSLNRYAYVTNRPTNFIDPLGMEKCVWPGVNGFPQVCEGGGYDDSGIDFFEDDGSISVGDYGFTDYLAVYGFGSYDGNYLPFGPTTANPPAPPKWKDCLASIRDNPDEAFSQGLLNVTNNWDALESAANANWADPALLASIGLQESHFNPNAIQSNGGGVGAFQIDLGKNPSITVEQALNVSWAANWTANELSTNFNAFINAGYDADVALVATIRSHNAGFRGTLSVLSSPPPGMVSLDYGTNPPNGDYVTSVLNIWANCFGGGPQ